MILHRQGTTALLISQILTYCAIPMSWYLLGHLHRDSCIQEPPKLHKLLWQETKP